MYRLSHRLFLASSLYGLVAVCIAGVPVQAGGKKPETQGKSNHQLVEAIRTLELTTYVLNQADHDYGGHRAKAVKKIKEAKHQLVLALEHSKKKPKVPKDFGKGKFKPEPQALSNFQLSGAIAILEETESYLKMAKHDYGGHKEKAMHDLHQAIHELHLALKFEKKAVNKT
jgi:hypothetical protein